MHFFAHSGLVGVKVPDDARADAHPWSENQPVHVTLFVSARPCAAPRIVIAINTRIISSSSYIGRNPGSRGWPSSPVSPHRSRMVSQALSCDTKLRELTLYEALAETH